MKGAVEILLCTHFICSFRLCFDVVFLDSGFNLNWFELKPESESVLMCRMVAREVWSVEGHIRCSINIMIAVDFSGCVVLSCYAMLCCAVLYYAMLCSCSGLVGHSGFS